MDRELKELIEKYLETHAHDFETPEQQALREEIKRRLEADA